MQQQRTIRMRVLSGLVSIAAASAGMLAGSARAEVAASFPSKPVKIVVPYTAGGGTDMIARAIANQLTEKWGKPVVIDNRGGASGMIGADLVAKAPADGYTLVLSDSAPFVILPSLYEKMAYAPLRDFAPVTVIARQSPIMVVAASTPVHDIKELVAYLKAHPNTSYASIGPGSYTHVAMEEFQKLTGTQLLHVPYKGTAQIITDMIGGRISLYIGTLGAFEQHEKAGTVRILATATAKRLPFRPELPTVAEAGVPGYSIDVWFGLAAPSGTPPDILDKIQRDVAAILKDKNFTAQVLTPQGLLPGGESRADFGALMNTDTARWKQLIDNTGVKL